MEQILNWAQSYYNIVSFKACKKTERWIFISMFIATICFFFYSVIENRHDDIMKFQLFTLEADTMVLGWLLEKEVTRKIFEYSKINNIPDGNILVVKRKILEGITFEKSINFG
ncbi:MAG: hypothetical protein NTW42_09195 [Deltaproteobacteria bacterium]|nr:hypothetical protein [Deltaproteobacteria bacterium]